MDTYTDQRGSLSPIHFDFAGFRPVRAFVVSAPDGTVRGGHAHAKCRQVFLCVSGRIDVEINDGVTNERISIDKDKRALLIGPRVWSQQVFHGESASMVVFCDIPYGPDEYIHSALELLIRT